MTEVIPFGVYRAPVHILRSTIRDRVNRHGYCYFQLLERLSSEAYVIHVAGSCDDLFALSRNEDTSTDERHPVFVSTITREELTECTLIAAPRAEAPTYVAPDCILKGKWSKGLELQLYASSAWLCYFKVLQTYPDGSCCVRVAALPHRLTADGSGPTYVTYFGQDEFALALPLDRYDLGPATCDLRNLATCDLREKVEDYAEIVLHRPVEHVHPKVALDKLEPTSSPKPAYPPEVAKTMRVSPTPLCVEQRMTKNNGDERRAQPVPIKTEKKVESILVPFDIARHTMERFKEVTKKYPTSRKARQQVWLQACLATLEVYKSQAKHESTFNTLQEQDDRARTVLVNWLSSGLLLVQAEPVTNKRQKKGEENPILGYLVTVEQPEVAEIEHRSHTKTA